MRARAATRLITVGIVAAGAATVGANPAGADPKTVPITIVCDNGSTYTAVVNGNGAWTPAHDVNSTSMLIPTSFGETTFVVTDAEGNIVDSATDEGDTKGNANPSLPTSTSCTFSGTDHVDDPELGPLTIEFSGSVSGFVTPANG